MRISGECRLQGVRDLLIVLKNQKIIGFFLIGILSSLIDITLLYVFAEYLGFWYLFSASGSYCCGILASYSLNKYLTFHDTDRHYIRQFSVFALISISSFVLTVCIIFLAVEMFSLHYLYAKVFAIGISFFWNYLGQSRITFGEKPLQ